MVVPDQLGRDALLVGQGDEDLGGPAGNAVVTSDRASEGDLFTNRPEIASALRGEATSGERTSETLGGDLLYVAVPVRAGDRILGAVRLTYPAQAVTDAIRTAVAREGIDLLTWSEAATALRARLDFLHRALGDPWPDVSDEALTAGLDSWLGPQLARVRSAQDLRRIDVAAALRTLLPWPQAGRLDDLAPERVAVPSGSSVATRACSGSRSTPRAPSPPARS